jgi:carboxypeptidase Q
MIKFYRSAVLFASFVPALLIPAAPHGLQQDQTGPLIPSAPPTDPMITAIITEGKDHSHVMDILHHIAVDIGARCTGSPELETGEKWAVGQFKSFGCQDVHREKWDDVPGFDRGPMQSARMVSPIPADFQFSTNAWTQGTNGPVRGKAVIDPTSLDEAKQMAAQLKGAWVIMAYKSSMGGARDRDAQDLQDYVDSCGIAGRVYPSFNELVHTHGSYKWRDGDKMVNKTPEKHPMNVDITIRKSDMERIQRWMSQEPVTLEFDIQNRWFKPIPQYNVVAEIKGTEKPDEMVIVSGHFDSWNGPGSQGANDNGTGSAMTLEAARILGSVHAKPKRTIRFILWTGEEQGLLGSHAYVEKHRAEMDKISAVIVDDGGTGYHAGYSVIEEMVPLMSAAVAPVNNAFPDMPEKIVVSRRFSQESGSDHDSFLRYAVPAFFTLEGGNIDYNYIWHSQNDRIENSVPNYMVQSATDAAAVAYSLANADSLLPRTRKIETAKP